MLLEPLTRLNCKSSFTLDLNISLPSAGKPKLLAVFASAVDVYVIVSASEAIVKCPFASTALRDFKLSILPDLFANIPWPLPKFAFVIADCDTSVLMVTESPSYVMVVNAPGFNVLNFKFLVVLSLLSNNPTPVPIFSADFVNGGTMFLNAPVVASNSSICSAIGSWTRKTGVG